MMPAVRVSINALRRLSWSATRQWQWTEDYCLWLEDGCSPLQAAEAMRLSAKEHGMKREHQVATRLYHCLCAGQPMSFALKGWLNGSLLQIFELGQQHDCLTELLQQFRQFEQRRYRLVMQLWRQRLYPLLILALVWLATVVAGEAYLPRLLRYSSGDVNHWSISVVNGIADTTIRWGWAIAVGALLTWGGYRWLGHHWTGSLRFRAERLGLFGYHRALGAVWVTQMMALLVRHRIGLQESLQRLQTISEGYLLHHLNGMSRQLAYGERRLARIMQTGLLPPPLLFRLHNSSQQGAVAEGLWRTALRCDSTIRQTLMRRQYALIAGIYGLIVSLLMLLIMAVGQVMQQLLMM